MDNKFSGRKSDKSRQQMFNLNKIYHKDTQDEDKSDNQDFDFTQKAQENLSNENQSTTNELKIPNFEIHSNPHTNYGTTRFRSKDEEQLCILISQKNLNQDQEDSDKSLPLITDMGCQTQQPIISKTSLLDNQSKPRIIISKIVTQRALNQVWKSQGLRYLEKDVYDVKYTWIDKVPYQFSHTWWKDYILSLYWAVITMITVGYGDIVAVNSLEQIFVILVTLMSCGIFAYSVNSIGNILSNMKKTNKEFKLQMSQLSKYMKKRKVSGELQIQVKKQFEYLHSNQDKNNEQSQNTINLLSEDLQRKVKADMYGKQIKEHKMFKLNFTDGFLNKLSLCMKEKRYGPNITIYDANNISDNLYILMEGNVNLCNSIQIDGQTYNKHLKILKPGEIFNIWSFFTDKASITNAISSSVIEVIYINKYDFMKEISLFPEDFERYCMYRDKLILQQDSRGLGLQCPICNKFTHFANSCNFVHFTPRKERVIAVKNKCVENQQRHQHKRQYVRLENAKQNAEIIRKSVIQYIMDNDKSSENEIMENLKNIMLALQDIPKSTNLNKSLDISTQFDKNLQNQQINNIEYLDQKIQQDNIFNDLKQAMENKLICGTRRQRQKILIRNNDARKSQANTPQVRNPVKKHRQSLPFLTNNYTFTSTFMQQYQMSEQQEEYESSQNKSRNKSLIKINIASENGKKNCRKSNKSHTIQIPSTSDNNQKTISFGNFVESSPSNILSNMLSPKITSIEKSNSIHVKDEKYKHFFSKEYPNEIMQSISFKDIQLNNENEDKNFKQMNQNKYIYKKQEICNEKQDEDEEINSEVEFAESEMYKSDKSNDGVSIIYSRNDTSGKNNYQMQKNNKSKADRKMNIQDQVYQQRNIFQSNQVFLAFQKLQSNSQSPSGADKRKKMQPQNSGGLPIQINQQRTQSFCKEYLDQLTNQSSSPMQQIYAPYAQRSSIINNIQAPIQSQLNNPNTNIINSQIKQYYPQQQIRGNELQFFRQQVNQIMESYMFSLIPNFEVYQNFTIYFPNFNVQQVLLKYNNNNQMKVSKYKEYQGMQQSKKYKDFLQSQGIPNESKRLSTKLYIKKQQQQK